jgi:hypothetical protein
MIPNDKTECPEVIDDTPTDTGVLKFVWTISKLKANLGNWSNNYTVQVTLTRQEPTVWMKFVKGEDEGCQD